MRGSASWLGTIALVAVAIAGCQEDTSNPTTDVAATPDTTVGGACQHASDCSDGNPCTTDSCAAGKCVHTPIDCDDGNPCTEDLCNGSGACQHDARPNCCNADGDCDDGDACTVDSCKAQVCFNVVQDPTCCNKLKDCDDENECTLDNCNNHKCEHLAITGPNCCKKDTDCLDSNACTNDSCKDGKCLHVNNGCCSADTDCDDKNPCHTGACDKMKCVFTATPGCCQTDTDCDDANLCTADVCKSGHCEHAPVEACCTTDADCKVSDPCRVGTCKIPGGATKGSCSIQLVNSPTCCTATPLQLNFDDGTLDGLAVTLLYPGTKPTWVPDTKRSTSPSYSLYFGDPATHTYKADAVSVGARAQSAELDLAKTAEPELHFQLWKQTDLVASSDVLSIVVTAGGKDSTPWSTAQYPEFANTQGAWVPVTVSLGGFASGKASISFVFDSPFKYPSTYEGVYVDDVAVVGKCQ